MVCERALPFALLSAAALFAGACSSPRPAIRFTRVPPADRGGPDVMDFIEGRVTGAKPGQKIVVFARSGVWWAEPRLGKLYTDVQPDSTWKTPTHLGTEYAAALVDPAWRPSFTSDSLPREGGPIAVVSSVSGAPATGPLHHEIRFAGYEWDVRNAPSDRGGNNLYDTSNASTDAGGALHLRLRGEPGHWTGAQVILNRSLGYGTYRLVIRDTANLDPAAVFAMYTLSDAGAASANRIPREWDVEISQWGDPAANNARFVLQPAYVGQNTVRFTAPAGVLTHTIRWESSAVRITTSRGRPDTRGAVASSHTFTAGIPVPGDEKFRINLYDYQRGPRLLQQGAEVVIESFEYLP